jgi:hypothetical protein
MKTFTMTVGDETAKFEVPQTFTLANLIDFMVNAGCNITPAKEDVILELDTEEVRELEPHEELGMSYMQWFRMYVSNW